MLVLFLENSPKGKAMLTGESEGSHDCPEALRRQGTASRHRQGTRHRLGTQTSLGSESSSAQVLYLASSASSNFLCTMGMLIAPLSVYGENYIKSYATNIGHQVWHLIGT